MNWRRPAGGGAPAPDRRGGDRRGRPRARAERADRRRRIADQPDPGGPARPLARRRESPWRVGNQSSQSRRSAIARWSCAATFARPAAFVFDAWTKPDLIVRWMPPVGWSFSACEVDLRPAGRYR
ncbi:MAG: hypothetical protein FJ033_11895 [Chloroflexi bacterium]|nr:hypothetical protein [Chloroflexota bacterium]